jgi:rRNA maturation RNase YbeY
MVQFNYANKKLNYNKKTALKKLVLFIFKKEKKALGYINYIFCDDEYLLQINQQFLNHKTYTDIITFPLNQNEDPTQAEIYISLDRVKDNAQIFGTNFKEELVRVVSHGALHLCGYKDKTKSQISEMRLKEQQYIEYYFKHL